MAVAWTNDMEEVKSNSMIETRASLYLQCQHDSQVREEECAATQMPQEFVDLCVKEIPIKKADCRSKKMCELKLRFMKDRCVDKFNNLSG